MPARSTSPLEAAVPAQTRRRVWKHPELTSHSLLVLSLDRLYLAPLAGTPKHETVVAVERGADLDDLLGPLAIEVELAAVRRVKLDLLVNSLIIESVGSRTGTRRLTVVFSTPQAADACFTKLWRRLGAGFSLVPYKRDPWALARTPLMVLAAVFAATAGLALAVSVFEDFGARAAADGELIRSPLATLLGWFNWRVVCGVGGAAAAVVQMWLYRRITQPPVSLELLRE